MENTKIILIFIKKIERIFNTLQCIVIIINEAKNMNYHLHPSSIQKNIYFSIFIAKIIHFNVNVNHQKNVDHKID